MSGAAFEWKGKEYEHNPKSADWYWSVGIIAAASAIAAILFHNYLFALLVIVAAGTLWLHAVRLPATHTFALTAHGLVINSTLYLYEHMRSFSMLEYIEGDRPPVLSIKTESWLAPHLEIPLNDVDVDEMFAFLLEHIHEEDHKHSIVDLVAVWLGF